MVFISDFMKYLTTPVELKFNSRFIVSSMEGVIAAEDLCSRPEYCLTIHLNELDNLVDPHFFVYAYCI